MRNVICMLQFALLIYSSFCNERILSKFYQNVYKVKELRAEVENYDENYFNILKIITYKYNRTTPVINGTINMKVAVKDKLEVVCQLRKFLSNEYRIFPVRFQVSIKSIFDSNVGGSKAVTNCGNITNTFFEKDVTYYAYNFNIDQNRFPPLVPNGRYRTDLQILYLNKEIAMLYSFGEVYTPIPYPKK